MQRISDDVWVEDTEVLDRKANQLVQEIRIVARNQSRLLLARPKNPQDQEEVPFAIRLTLDEAIILRNVLSEYESSLNTLKTME